jgi:beta-lactamase class D
MTIGHDHYVKALRRLGYGDHDPAGLSNGFWLGPQAGGFQTITTGQQADFIRRFYAGALPVKPEALRTVQGLTADETRPTPGGGQAVIQGRAASCSSVVDGSRRVGWWVGRIKTPKRDMIIAASVEATEAPPGIEIERRLEDIFAEAGIIPPGES